MPNEAKTIKWEKVYVFVSSTFNDMHAERDYLVKNVFPRLSEWCERRKLRMVDIDLRWGVTETDATQNRNVVGVCLERIDECRPFFICLLGQRYGWIPQRKDISEEAVNSYPGLKEAINKGASVTELEILHSAISPFHSRETIERKGYERSKYAYFYLRDDSYLKDLPEEPQYLRRVYSDTEETDEDERKRLAGKRNELIKKIESLERRPFHRYQAAWSEDSFTSEIAIPLRCPATLEENRDRWRREWLRHAGVRVSGLDVEEDPSEAVKAREFNEKLTKGRLVDFSCNGEDLGNIVLGDLIQAIEERFPDHQEVSEDELQREIDQQEQFVFVNSEGFIKRTGDFDELNDYVKGDSNKIFVLTAEGGMGKSTLLANWVDNYQASIEGESDESVHFRSIGASDGSTTVYPLLRLLLREIKEVSWKLDDDIPDDPQELRNALPELLQKVGQKGRTVIVIDALNQLETGLSDLTWLPRQLPDNIKLIVSFKREDKAAEELYASLVRDQSVQLAEVRPFEDREDRKKLVRTYLSQYLKELDEKYIEVIIDSPAAYNPLYLRVVLSELRIFGAFAKLEEKIRSDFGDTPDSAFEGMLQRLETDPAYSPIEPGEALPLIFGLLAHSRHGLAVEELTSILLHALGMGDTVENRQDASDTVYLFMRQVRPFLARRGGRYDFFYESFKNAALKRYVSEKDELPRRMGQSWHRLLAHYFNQVADPRGDGSWTDASPRGLRELPYHLTEAKDWEGVERVLCDLRFIEAKCAAGMTYDLIADYNAALNALPEAQEERQEELEHEERIKKYTEDLIAYAKGEIEHLDIIPSVEPWSEERIREDTERIINNPTRLDRIRAFSQFVNAESHGLVKFGAMPGFCLQQAYNSASSGPVASAAETVINTGVDNLLLLQHPNQRLEYNPHPVLLKTLEQSTDWLEVRTVSITPDGKIAVLGGNLHDNALQVWDLEVGKCLRTLKGHTDSVYSVSITPDGKRAVSGSEDETLRVWDLESGECLRTLKGHTNDVKSVAIIPDGRRTVSGSEDNTLRVWDLENGECLRTLEWHSKTVNSIAITPDGRRAVSGSEDNTLRVWDLGSGECLTTLEGHTDWVNSVSITPDGRRAVSGSKDENLRVWDLESGECLRTLWGHTGSVNSVSVTPDGKKAVSGAGDAFSDDKTLRVWDLGSGECLTTLEGHTHWVFGVSVTPDGKRAASVSFDGTLRLWDLKSGECLRTLKEHTDLVDSVSVTPDGKKAVSGSADNTLRVWDLESGKCLTTLEGHTDWVNSVSITPDGRRAVSGSKDENLRLWDLESGECLRTLEGHTGPVESVSITPDGGRAVSGSGTWLASADNTLRVWDLESGECLRTLDGHTRPVKSVSITPDGRRAVSGSWDKTLRVWDLDNGECFRTLEGHTIGVASVSITPDGKRAVSGGEDSTLRVWDLEVGKCLRTLRGHTHYIKTVNVTPDGKKAVSGSWDYNLRVWDLGTGVCVAIYQGNSEINSVSQLRAGGRLALGTTTGDVVFLAPINFPMESPVITPVRIWLYGEGGYKGRWNDDITAVCQWCGQRFPVSDEVLDVIKGINQDAKLSPGQSPCLELPAEAWEEPRLLSKCPACHQPLKFNPFIVDNSEHPRPVKSPSKPEQLKEAGEHPRPVKSPDQPEQLKEASKLRDLANKHLDQDEYDEALSLYQQALAIDESTLGPNHHDVAIDLNCMAVTYSNKGKYDEAMPLFQRALAIDENTLGPNHPEVANDLNLGALSYYIQGKYDEAMSLFQRAVNIAEVVLGPEHPDTKLFKENMKECQDAMH
jgi:WD40 repeat protein